MKNYKEQFKGKKITVMGLGLLGRGLGYTKFLAECGADLIVTDLKTKEQLATSLKVLAKFPNIKYTIGEHKLEDFRGRDIVMKMAGVSMNSIYIEEARRDGARIEMDVSLFAKCAPGVMIVGITGTRGKSMTTTLVYEILKQNASFIKTAEDQGKNNKNRNIYAGGNLRGVATLPLLKKAQQGDILVCELDSWQLQGFGEDKMSPSISVFTSFMPDHMNYYGSSFTTSKAMGKYFDDKANIFKYQNKSDILIISPDIKKIIPKKLKSKLVVVNKKDVEGWKFIVPGAHQLENLACAVTVAQLLGVPIKNIRKSVASFKGLEGRLQYLKTVKGVKIYNDNNATTPTATVAGIKALTSNSAGKKIVLICGGADKNLDLEDLVKVINKSCKAVVFIPGTGTDKLARLNLKIESHRGFFLKDIVTKAMEYAKKGDIVLFSPAFASFGMFNNEYERNDLFMKIVKGLK